MKKKIKGGPRRSRTEAFLEWAEENPGEIVAIQQAGAEVIHVADCQATPGLDLPAVLHALSERGVTRLLVEGGGRVTAALLAADSIDRIVWFRAPMMLGGDGVPASESFGLQTLNAAPRFNREGAAPAGEDMVETYKAR